MGEPAARRRLAVLISGRGSNLQALVSAIDAGELAAQIVAVGCDRADAAGIEIARAHDLPVVLRPRADFATREEFESALFAGIEQHRPDWVVLAGFMRVLSAQAVQRWEGRAINLHPSLLPLYPGLHTHARALEAGDKNHGASVHLVTAQLDGGPVIGQIQMRIEGADDADLLAERLRPLEHRLLLRVVALLVAGRLAASGNTLVLDGVPLLQPLQLT